MQTIIINVVGKVATAEGNPFIVCGNSDYIIKFNFDNAWAAYAAKTARFTYEHDGEPKYNEVVFTGNQCTAPVIMDTKKVEIGVYAGDILSTTRCKITCKPSILDGEGIEHEEPPEDVYNQIVGICNDAVTAAGEAEAAATGFEATTRETFANAIKNTITGEMVTADDVSPVEHKISCRLTSDIITDFSTVKVSKCGKNLLPVAVLSFDNWEADKTNNGQLYKLDIPEGHTYTFSCKLKPKENNDYAYLYIVETADNWQTKETIGEVVQVAFSKHPFVFAAKKGFKYALWWFGSTSVFNDYYYDLQLEFGPSATEFEAYKGVETYTPNADGTVEGITSLSPSMTLLTDTAGTVINCEYNRDTNKALTNMVTAEGTVVSPNADFAEVAEWADGNPDNEDRTGYFVCANVPVNGIIMRKATSVDDVKGVSISAPAFAGNYSKDKLDGNGRLLPKYSYVAIIGFVPVIDNGSCTVGGRCMPDDNGCAIPSSNSMGYQVVNRIDENRVLIIIEPNGDMVQRIKAKINGINQNFANVIKGNKENKRGLKLTDVSPIEHELKLKVASKNLFDGELKLWSINDRVMSTKCIKVKPNTWYRITVFDYTIQHPFFKVYGSHTGAMVETEEFLVGSMVTTFNSGEFEYIFFREYYPMAQDGITLDSRMQIEEIANQTAPGTEYTPCVDVSTVEVSRYGKNMCSNIFEDYANTKYKSIHIGNYNLVMSLQDKDVSVDVSGCYFGWAVDPDNINAGYRWVVDSGTIKAIKTNVDMTSEKICPYLVYYPSGEDTFNKIMQRWNIQVEGGNTSTEYEPYKPRKTAHTAADGTVEGLTSISPSMTVLTDTEGVVMDIDYNIDTKTYIDNKFAELQALILEG